MQRLFVRLATHYLSDKSWRGKTKWQKRCQDQWTYYKFITNQNYHSIVPNFIHRYVIQWNRCKETVITVKFTFIKQHLNLALAWHILLPNSLTFCVVKEKHVRFFPAHFSIAHETAVQKLQRKTSSSTSSIGCRAGNYKLSPTESKASFGHRSGDVTLTAGYPHYFTCDYSLVCSLPEGTHICTYLHSLKVMFFYI